ncbi:hypothetical protein [Streptomyces sp. NPDC046261]
MTVVRPHIARGRRLLLALLVTAALTTLVLVVALTLYLVPRLG